MDDKGFIFTADATLALVVIIVFTASVVVYALLPVYQGDDHRHLEALADSILQTMEENGELRSAGVSYASGGGAYVNDTDSKLNSTLQAMVPAGVGYKLTIGSHSVEDNRGLITSTNVATRVRVISAPEQGWMGRAYYKLEKVEYHPVNQTTVTTVWNFHNWLQNFGPWGNHLETYRYWGGTNTAPQNPKNIAFTVPATGTINGAQVLIGSNREGSSGSRPSYGANFTLNGINHVITNSSFNYLYTRSGSGGKMYNYKGNIPGSELTSGTNNYYLQFLNQTSSHHMPWFSIIANYTTTLNVPEGVLSGITPFSDIAGVGTPYGSVSFNLDTGAVSNVPGRSVTWNWLQSHDYDISTPFELTGMRNIGHSSAVATEQDLYVPPGYQLFDAYTVVNSYGGCDGAIVQVKDSLGTWRTVFTSFDTQYTSLSYGYGNLPGTVALHDKYDINKQYLKPGHNTVRIILYDCSESGDYDLVGLRNCYSGLTYSALPIKWDIFTYNSYQNGSSSSTKSYTQMRNFTVSEGAQEALLFLGTGLDTRNVTVTLSNGTASKLIYAGIPLYSIDLGKLDNTTSPKIMVDGNGTLKNGTYFLTVKVTPSEAYESGDGSTSPGPYGTDADPELYSGTRISVLYPKFLENAWSSSYASTPDDARALAITELRAKLQSHGINTSTVPDSAFKTEAIFAGDMATATPVRLDLWKY